MIGFIKNIVRLILYSSFTYRLIHPFAKNIFEGKNVIGKNSRLRCCKVGFGTYFGSNNSIYDANIGKFCSIGSNINFAIGSHPTQNFVSTHPAFFSTKKQAGFTYVQNERYDELNNSRKMIIEDDVWIGDNVIFLKKVHVGTGAVIGAGSIITKDIPPYAIVAGVPAKLIKFRFKENEIKKLSIINWQNWPIKKIQNSSIYFNDVDLFINKFEKEV